jgi:hypothetical protein
MHPDDEREQRQVDRALESLDAPMPELRLETIVAKASAARGETVSAPREGRWMLQRAAALVALLLVVGAAAYAIPGSPVRRWLDRALAARHAATSPRPASPASDDRAGISVDPGTNLVIEFRSVVPGGEARVSFTDGAEVGIRAPAGAATFSFEPDRVIVTPRAGGAIVHVDVPRTAPRVEIRVAGRSVFLAQAGRAASGAVSGERRIPLSSP